jgi:Flp pilus assembly protein TadD
MIKPLIVKALEINPNDANALRNKGIALSRLGKDKDAEEHFARAKRLEAEKRSMM